MLESELLWHGKGIQSQETSHSHSRAWCSHSRASPKCYAVITCPNLARSKPWRHLAPIQWYGWSILHGNMLNLVQNHVPVTWSPTHSSIESFAISCSHNSRIIKS